MTGIVTIETLSGSTYEVDVEGKRIRRMGNTGGSAPTRWFGTDGTWNTYESLSYRHYTPRTVCLLVHWPTSPEGSPTTMTSGVRDPRLLVDVEAMPEWYADAHLSWTA